MFHWIRKPRYPPHIMRFITSELNYAEAQRRKPEGERNMYPAGTSADTAFNCVCELLLGEDFGMIISDPMGASQANTVLLDKILSKYWPKYNKIAKKYWANRRDEIEPKVMLQMIMEGRIK